MKTKSKDENSKCLVLSETSIFSGVSTSNMCNDRRTDVGWSLHVHGMMYLMSRITRASEQPEEREVHHDVLDEGLHRRKQVGFNECAH